MAFSTKVLESPMKNTFFFAEKLKEKKLKKMKKKKLNFSNLLINLFYYNTDQAGSCAILFNLQNNVLTNCTSFPHMLSHKKSSQNSFDNRLSFYRIITATSQINELFKDRFLFIFFIF